MKHWGVERRRVPRVSPPASPECCVSLRGSLTVRLLDFSESGVLLASKVELARGERVELRAIAPTGPVHVPVEIRHVSLRMIHRAGERFCAGAAFLAPSSGQKARLADAFRAEGM